MMLRPAFLHFRLSCIPLAAQVTFRLPLIFVPIALQNHCAQNGRMVI
jgi:hypothetical protein